MTNELAQPNLKLPPTGLITGATAKVQNRTTKPDSGLGVLWIATIALWGLVPGLTPTATMFAVAFSMYTFVKTHVLLTFLARANDPPRIPELIAWYVCWPGLDPRPFFDAKEAGVPSSGSFAFAVSKIALGVWLLCFVAPRFAESQIMLGGWIAMVGLAFMVHFGGIHLLALVWNRLGRQVRPIMDWPIAATSLSEFWGKRWNLAFRDYAHTKIFGPLSRRTNLLLATLGGFAFSGFIHELAISLPAGGGYGLPMLYFLLQGLGVAAERKIAKRGWKLKGNIYGSCWTIAWVVLPAPILFHPYFVQRVILPMVEFLTR